ncbi:glycoside hydrolase family 71 protein [Aulographum hederae CBS 113979]|uniref:Glycoside hydrolase family 71 protein n=1 Tax=Aulographum hederae CBS 113979 TaxID=1176131 RepID=A0A6G1H1G5_9PEZI|nr:glycoside hydrolase family 71 protein [Aulographum hederae CBS 113979]
MSLLNVLLASLAFCASMADAQDVFAHIVTGVFADYTPELWARDIKLAQDSLIDGFVLNIAPPYAGNTKTQIANAFNAANAASTPFKLFFSFDYLGAGGDNPAWPRDGVVQVLKDWGSNSAHFLYKNAAYVSTFEGTENVGDWPYIRSQLSFPIFFVPDWTSLGPTGLDLSLVDGAFSWNMWPEGPNNMTSTPDLAWSNSMRAAGKLFMMGISPWFFTDLPGYGKNFTWRGDSMWHTRWMEDVYEVKPEIVEIVTWNDYGESHYISPIFTPGIPTGDQTDAIRYVEDMPHDAWRDVLPYYISKFKNGGTEPTIEKERLVYWYRLTPASAGNANGVTGNNCNYQDCFAPGDILEDAVFVTALVKSLPADVTIQIGGNAVKSFPATQTGANHFTAPFDGQTGKVTFTITRRGDASLTGIGEAVTSEPTGADGLTNFNAWVGGVSG